MFLPMFYSMINSVPACDDFAFGARTISNNLFLDAIGYSVFCWFDHSGRWLLFFFQKLINPLNIHVHLGRVYGVWMIILFLLTFVIMYYSLQVILSKLLEIKGDYLNIALLLMMAVLFTTYYYVEVFNWYIGGTAYAVPFVLFLLAFAFAIRYEDTLERKYYVGTILAGLIPATNEIFDIPLGIIYLYMVFYVFEIKITDYKRVLNRLAPLFIFILGGMTTVFAPGNFARQSVYATEPNLIAALKQTIIDLIVRCKDIAHHPFTIFLFICLIVLGMKVGKQARKNNVLITIMMTALVSFGALFPYVYGHATTSTFVEVRMLYFTDYVMFIGICIGCIRFGQFLITKNAIDISGKQLRVLAFVITIVTICSLLFNKNYLKIVQIDIINRHAVIAESYEYWDGIIREIEESKDSNVVIRRDEEPAWNPYFLYMGIVEEDIYDVPLDAVFQIGKILPNVYYQKESIRYVIENN